MSAAVLVVDDVALAAYDFGPTHPLTPVRVRLALDLARALGVFDGPQVSVVAAEQVPDEILELVHEREYVDAVRRCGTPPLSADVARGLGTPDDPVFEGMHEASARVVGATLRCAEAVWRGTADHAVNLAGGLHHAMPDSASGFCIYDDPAVAIAWLLRAGAERVAYVDLDVHHGDGPEAIFRDDPRVLTVSLHESGRYLFPGTGFPDPTRPTAVDVALPPGTDDAGWLRAFWAVVPPALHRFRPQVLVSQHGCDTHALDPLAHLGLTVDGQRAASIAVHDLAHELCDGRWVATGGGGYERVQVVPRAWAHLLAVACGMPVDVGTDVPEDWRRQAQHLGGELAPSRMGDGADVRYDDVGARPLDARDAVDAAVLEALQAAGLG